MVTIAILLLTAVVEGLAKLDQELYDVAFFSQIDETRCDHVNLNC